VLPVLFLLVTGDKQCVLLLLLLLLLIALLALICVGTAVCRRTAVVLQ
jgi:hypothetical protein